ncbi:hypothetical protein RZO55_22880 [Clostridium boliviensis]|uniref:LPXTG cell wall anchor domain-containing protein n=1 Tax=Clostridium boliviensis TaxID=318465 RepID=A0ABU4GRZ9_9CLOT|nr:hypothetical protein [Clostridium boliviensis]MDW2800417.1 hypothetical protein [Clostridium boliviensis]
MILSTSSEADFDTEIGEAYTLEDGEETSFTASLDQNFAIVLLLFLGILIGVCLIGRRRWHD